MGFSSRFSKTFLRPSNVIFLLGFLFLAGQAVGSPVPGDDDTAKELGKSFNDAASTTKDFFDRAKNTFTGKADDTNKGLTPLELAGVIAAAVILLLILPCCIGYCLCECVKELICCICCCGCCRD